MADRTENCQPSSSVSDGINGSRMTAMGEDREKELQDLMERLRSRSGHHTPWPDTAKALHHSVTDKRQQTEVLEKTLLHRHLEALQKAFKVTNLSSMLERLEALARRTNLKYTVVPGSCVVFLASDLFTVEISLDKTGCATDAKIKHNGEPMVCQELIEALNENHFEEVADHLEGLSSMYSIGTDKSVRVKAQRALQCLEEDLNLLAELQSMISSVPNYIHKSRLGILVPRIGGLPMKLTYFVGPYDLLNEKTRKPYPMTVEAITENRLGHSVSICVVESSPLALQTMPLITVKSSEGKSIPSFSATNNMNSQNLPAVFILKLQKPLPISLPILLKIQNTTGVDFVQPGDVESLATLIVQYQTGDKSRHFNCDKGLHVTLPDQQHRYFLSGTLNGNGALQGSVVTRIPFTHPTHVPQIILLLRQQVLLNTLLASCVRTNPIEDCEKTLTFEVTPLSLQYLSVSFEHPLKEAMAVAEFDLTDLTGVRCKVSCTGEDAICSDEFATKVIQRCLSLPVTMRAILQKASQELDRQTAPLLLPLTPVSLPMSQVGQERRQAFISNHHPPNYPSHQYSQVSLLNNQPVGNASPQPQSPIMQPPRPPPPLLPPPPLPPPPTQQATGCYQDFMDPTKAPDEVIEAIKQDKISKNPMLASLLDQTPSPEVPQQHHHHMHHQQQQHQRMQQQMQVQSSVTQDGGRGQTSMLSQLLGDVSSNPNAIHQLPPAQPKIRRQRKRRSTSERSPIGKSPKRDFTVPSLDIDLANCNSGMGPLDAPHATPHPTPPLTTPECNMSDDMYSQESHVSKLASTLDNIIKQESDSMSSLAPLMAPPPAELASTLVDGNVVKNEHHIGTNNRITNPAFPVETGASDAPIKIEDKDSVFDDKLFHSQREPKGVASKEKQLNDFLSKGGTSGKLPPNLDKPRTFDQDNFDFNATIAMKNDTHLKQMLENKRADNSLANHSLDDYETAKVNSKLALDRNLDFPNAKEVKEEMKMIVVKEKRRDRKEGREDPDSGRPPEKEKITVKLRTIMKDPGASSPHNVVDVVRKEKSKSSRSGGEKGEANSDNEVAQITSSISNTNSGISSSSPRILSSHKVESKERVRSEKKKRSSKVSDGEKSEKKRKRTTEEAKKDLLSKKQKIYDFEDSEPPGDNYRVDRQHVGKPTTIKITTTGGKMHISNRPASASSSSSSPITAKPKSSSPSTLKNLKHNHDKSASPKLGRSSSSQKYNRSKSEGAGSGPGNGDPKLLRTPSIKLKPLPLPVTCNATTPTSSTAKSSQSPVTNSTRTSNSAPNSASQSSSKNKVVVGHGRKGSLSAVIDKLKKQHTQTKSGHGHDGKDVEKGAGVQHGKAFYDSLRLAIIREGNKPSTPTKEVATFKSSHIANKRLDATKIPLESKKATDTDSTKGEQLPKNNSSGNLQAGTPKNTSSLSKTASTSSSRTPPTNPNKLTPSRSDPRIEAAQAREAQREHHRENVPNKIPGSIPRTSTERTTPTLEPQTSVLAKVDASERESKRETSGVSGGNTSSRNVNMTAGNPTMMPSRTPAATSSASGPPNKHVTPPSNAAASHATRPSGLSLTIQAGKHGGVSTGAAGGGNVQVKAGAAGGTNHSSPSVGRPPPIPLVSQTATSKSTSQRSSSPSALLTKPVSVPSNGTSPSSLKPPGPPARQSSRENDKLRKTSAKMEDDRLHGRHFLDVVSKLQPGAPAANSSGGQGTQGSSGSGTVLTRDGRKEAGAERRGSSGAGRCSSADSGIRSNCVGEGSTRTDSGPSSRPTSTVTDMRTDPRLESRNSNLTKDGCAPKLDAHRGDRTSEQRGRPVSPSIAAIDDHLPSMAESSVNRDDFVKCNNSKLLSSNSAVPLVTESDNKENKKCGKVSMEYSTCILPAAVKARTEERERSRAEERQEPSRAKTTWSPCSDISSPDGLVIDCPGTPRSTRSPAPRHSRSPAPARSPQVGHSPLDASVKSPMRPSPSPRKQSKLSPIPSIAKSPMMQRNSGRSPLENSSPCEIDDDLMDAAVSSDIL